MMKTPYLQGFSSSDRDRIRTYDRLLRRQVLYPAELRDHFGGANIVSFSTTTSNLFLLIRSRLA